MAIESIWALKKRARKVRRAPSKGFETRSRVFNPVRVWYEVEMTIVDEVNAVAVD